MNRIVAIILFAISSPQALADDSGCAEIAHGAGIAVGAMATFSAGPAGSAGAAVLRALGGWAAYELTNRTATQLICDNSTAIEMAIHEYNLIVACGNGNYAACDLTGVMMTSFARDFALCGVCSVQEVMGAFLMEDNARKAYFEQLRRSRGRSWSYLQVIPRNHLQLDAEMLTAYYQGVGEGLQRRLLEAYGSF